MFKRRQIISGLLRSVALAVVPRFIDALPSRDNRMRAIVHEPIELQAVKGALVGIGQGVASFSTEVIGKSVVGVWLRNHHGKTWLVSVAQRDLQWKFEVFTLGIAGIEELRTRWLSWKVPIVPGDMPEPIRQLIVRRPPEPVVPNTFEVWPFKTDRITVLRRVDFIIEGVNVTHTFGENPNTQAAGRPGHIPVEATASCEVAVGVLFTGEAGRRLMIAVDSMPMDLIFTQDAVTITDYLASCDQVDLGTYIAQQDAQ